MNRAQVSAGEMAYVDEGEGPAVVLLHGFPTNSYLWRALVPELAARMRVIAPDLLGYGQSDKPEDAPVHLRAQAGYVRELLQRLGIEEFAVVGHDVGGAVAQLLALDGSGVRTLVLMDVDAFDAWPSEGVRMLQDAEPEQETSELVREVIDLALDLGMSHVDRLSEEAREAYRASFAGPEGAAAFFRAARGIDGLGLAGRDDELAKLDVPALIVWGEDDPYVEVDLAERLAGVLPDAALVLLPGCSHFLPEEVPETIGPLIAEFLRARYLGLPHGHDHSSGPLPIDLLRHGPA